MVRKRKHMKTKRQHIRSIVICHLKQRRKGLFAVRTQRIKKRVKLQVGQIVGLTVSINVPLGTRWDRNFLSMRNNCYAKYYCASETRHFGTASELKMALNGRFDSYIMEASNSYVTMFCMYQMPN